MPRRAAAIVLLLAVACQSPRQPWLSERYEGISYGALFNVVLTTVDAEGFALRVRDLDSGEIQSDWTYGQPHRRLRGPTRLQVLAEVEPEDDGAVTVRLRVAQQVLRKGGLLATNVRESDDWEDVEDQHELGVLLLTKVARLVAVTSSGAAVAP